MKALVMLCTAWASLASTHAAALMAQRARDAQPQRVVFVCEHGTVKSVVALEYFNMLARQKGLAFEAVSRGTRPDSLVPPVIRTGLARDGFDLSAFRPLPFTSGDVSSAALIVALDAEVEPVVRSQRPVERWDSLPSVTADYANGSSAIRRRVEQLIDSLSRASRSARPPE